MDHIIYKMKAQQLNTKKHTFPKYSDKFISMIAKNEVTKNVEQPSLKNMEKRLVENHKKLSQQYFFYKIKSIGVGAHSFVYLVQEQSSKMLLAQKSIIREHAQKYLDELINQVKILSFLNHQNLIKLYHFQQTQSHFNLILQYAEDSLFGLKQKFIFFKQKQIIEIIRQLLNGLSFLHKHNIVHGDIKIENIMIANGSIKICDFGYAHQHNKYKSRQTIGTLEYLSPEYANGQDSGHKRDIWAVGILAFEMLLGKSPFEGLKQTDKWSKLIKNSPNQYFRQMIELQKQMGIKSLKVQSLVKEIFCEIQSRKTAEELLLLPIFNINQ